MNVGSASPKVLLAAFGVTEARRLLMVNRADVSHVVVIQRAAHSRAQGRRDLIGWRTGVLT